MDILNLVDISGYSPVHYAAFKNQERAIEVLIQYVLNDPNFVSEPERRPAVLKQWLCEPSKGEDGFTALHFASFHGNAAMIKMLVGHGADIHAVNSQGINMMHVAA